MYAHYHWGSIYLFCGEILVGKETRLCSTHAKQRNISWQWLSKKLYNWMWLGVFSSWFKKPCSLQRWRQQSNYVTQKCNESLLLSTVLNRECVSNSLKWCESSTTCNKPVCILHFTVHTHTHTTPSHMYIPSLWDDNCILWKSAFKSADGWKYGDGCKYGCLDWLCTANCWPGSGSWYPPYPSSGCWPCWEGSWCDGTEGFCGYTLFDICSCREITHPVNITLLWPFSSHAVKMIACDHIGVQP